MSILSYMLAKLPITQADESEKQMETLDKQTQWYYDATQKLLNYDSKTYLAEIANISQRMN